MKTVAQTQLSACRAWIEFADCALLSEALETSFLHSRIREREPSGSTCEELSREDMATPQSPGSSSHLFRTRHDSSAAGST